MKYNSRLHLSDNWRLWCRWGVDFMIHLDSMGLSLGLCGRLCGTVHVCPGLGEEEQPFVGWEMI